LSKPLAAASVTGTAPLAVFGIEQQMNCDRPQAGSYNIHEIGLDDFLAFTTCRLTCGGVRRRAVRVADMSRDDH